jgi:hypothetical protein
MMAKLHIGDKVEVIDEKLRDWYAKEGEIVAITKNSYVDGYQKKWRKEYIVQFKHPMDLGWFTRGELKRKEGKDERKS